ncbi:MAG TPA: FAD-dependent oxidoreductase [Usitatibacter sp.]|nr:FAD-dependent oxidoreductase [Usitatibacter sp.]
MTLDTRLLGRDIVAQDTWSFRFAKPPGFKFKPGQAIDLILPGFEGEPDAAKHAFSIVSAPREDDVTIATRMRGSAYKRALGALEVGAPASIDGPFGSLTLHKDAQRDALLVAGGIGITPFMSMLRHASGEPALRRHVLVYSNRRPEDSAFLAELQALEKGERVRLVATMTNMERSSSPWTGPSRMVDAALVKDAVKDLSNPIACLAGPPAMVAGMREVLVAAGIDEDDIRAEEFFGY